ncbi:MAG: hypothetical protein M1365_12545 [Actinobacteria bacterium]|nr:hypothetical protein [Actinomycetota bacterium]
MPRGRILDKEAISQSKRLSELSSDTGRLVYTWLLVHLDREGRFSADPLIIKGNVFPRVRSMTVVKIEKSINEMAVLELIDLYNINGDKYLQFRKFKEFQTHLDREAPSKIPAPNNENIINSGINPTKSDLIPLKQFNTIQLKTTKYSEDSDELRLSKLLITLIRQRNPGHKEPDLQKWAYDIDLMLRIDKRDPQIIEKLIIWCQQDRFWQNNILSTAKLRAQYDQLLLKMKADKDKLIAITEKIEADRKYQIGVQKEKEWNEFKRKESAAYKKVEDPLHREALQCAISKRFICSCDKDLDICKVCKKENILKGK